MNCTLCPRACGVDRSIRPGPCHAGAGMRVAAIVAHRGEEPALVKGEGSGAVFFSGCPLQCAFCQNRQISHHQRGYALSPAQLADYLLALERLGCSNINLVSPTHFAGPLAQALAQARGRGLTLPVVLNSSGYESIATLEELRPYIDIYLMDIKYGDNQTGSRLCQVRDYWDKTRQAVSWCWKTAGALRQDTAGAGVAGLIVRHLVLPGMLSNPFAVLEFVAGLSLEIPVSLMSQYDPKFYDGLIPEMRRPLDKAEYAVVLERADELGIEMVFTQAMDCVQSYSPDFQARRPFGDGINLLSTASDITNENMARYQHEFNY
ncbi:MAG: radical SAM protein [Syntrophaceae bacterium]